MTEPMSKPSRESKERQVLDMVAEMYDLGHTDTMTFAVPKVGAKVALPLIRNSGFAESLISTFYGLHREAITQRIVDNVLPILRAQAELGRRSDLALRCKRQGSRIFIDLGGRDGRVVQVSKKGWKVRQPDEPHFYRSPLTAALPEPVRGGNIEDLRNFVAVSDDSWPMFVGWMVAAFDSSIAQPIAYFTGPPGSGKTTTARCVGRLIDPLTVSDWQRPTSPRGWTAAASAVYMVPLDNVSQIDSKFADQLCRTVTGAGDVENELYTNSSLHATGYRRLITLTTVTGASYLRGDLASRVMRVELEPIVDRESEASIMKAFERARPKLFGALLDLLVDALGRIDEAEPAEDVRMVDFGRFLSAIDLVRGTQGLPTYRDSRSRQATDVIHGDGFLNAVHDLITDVREWQGSAGDLLTVLESRSTRNRHWPDSPIKVSNRIVALAEDFALLGVHVERGRDNNSRWIKLESLIQ